MNKIKDVKNEVSKEIVLKDSNILFAQQKDNNALILVKLESSIERFDGKKAHYKLEHRWLSNQEDIHSVQGNDFTYWTKSEMKKILANIASGQNLFDNFDLIG